MACKLGSTRNRLVFGTGANKPRILFIGEGPGAEEDAQGLPFVGRAGALLTGFITALGLTRSDVYITNVVKCRPPRNRTPEPDEVASCRPILLRQIELLDPRLIVTLGNVPLKALNPQAGGITKERGRIFPYLQWRVLPTFHPSYLLRNSRDIPLCWADFRQAFHETYLSG
jgi:DNA polymerase